MSVAVMKATRPEPVGLTLAQRQRNAAMKDEAVFRAACPEHTPEQQAERDLNAATIERVWGAKVAELMDLRNARCSDLRRWGDAARAEEQKVAALRAAVAAPAKLKVAGPETEAAEIDALARELYQCEPEEYVYVDVGGIRDPFRTENNKRTARAAARIVHAQRADFAARQAPIVAARAGHQALAGQALFGSLRLQLARGMARDLEGKGIYGDLGIKKDEPLPLDATGCPDPFAAAIKAAQARNAERDSKRRR